MIPTIWHYREGKTTEGVQVSVVARGLGWGEERMNRWSAEGF